jgi:PAS domain S-box-containing protein
MYYACMRAAQPLRISDWLWEQALKPAGISGFFVLVALLWTFPLQHVISYPFVFLFFGAIIGSAWFGGFVAGLLATGMSYVFIAFFFVPPLYSISVNEGSRSFVASFVLCAIVITAISSARKKGEIAIRNAKDELERRVDERTAELQLSNQEILGRERQLLLLAEAIPQQIWSADLNGSIEYCNHNLLSYIGRSADELKGEAFYSIFHPEDAAPFYKGWEAARTTTENFELQARVLGMNGAYRWFLIRGIPQRATDGKIVRWYGVHVDIEDQQSAQQRLFQAQEDLSRTTRTTSLAEMAASIAHELNQPLTALVTNASACKRWLTTDPPNFAKAVNAAERIIDDSTRASSVLSRVRSLFNQSDYVREETDLNRLILDLERLLKGEALRWGVSIELKLDDRLPPLQLDPVQIQQVLFNLAMNGMESMAMIEKPKILKISTEFNGRDAVTVRVEDRGPGFLEEDRARLFEPFFTTKREGTGMGLAICRSIIEAHDGRIWGTRLERGAAFQFELKVGE